MMLETRIPTRHASATFGDPTPPSSFLLRSTAASSGAQLRGKRGELEARLAVRDVGIALDLEGELAGLVGPEELQRRQQLGRGPLPIEPHRIAEMEDVLAGVHGAQRQRVPLEDAGVPLARTER